MEVNSVLMTWTDEDLEEGRVSRSQGAAEARARRHGLFPSLAPGFKSAVCPPTTALTYHCFCNLQCRHPSASCSSPERLLSNYSLDVLQDRIVHGRVRRIRDGEQPVTLGCCHDDNRRCSEAGPNKKTQDHFCLCISDEEGGEVDSAANMVDAESPTKFSTPKAGTKKRSRSPQGAATSDLQLDEMRGGSRANKPRAQEHGTMKEDTPSAAAALPSPPPRAQTLSQMQHASTQQQDTFRAFSARDSKMSMDTTKLMPTGLSGGLEGEQLVQQSLTQLLRAAMAADKAPTTVLPAAAATDDAAVQAQPALASKTSKPEPQAAADLVPASLGRHDSREATSRLGLTKVTAPTPDSHGDDRETKAKQETPTDALEQGNTQSHNQDPEENEEDDTMYDARGDPIFRAPAGNKLTAELREKTFRMLFQSLKRVLRASGTAYPKWWCPAGLLEAVLYTRLSANMLLTDAHDRGVAPEVGRREIFEHNTEFRDAPAWPVLEKMFPLLCTGEEYPAYLSWDRYAAADFARTYSKKWRRRMDEAAEKSVIDDEAIDEDASSQEEADLDYVSGLMASTDDTTLADLDTMVGVARSQDKMSQGSEKRMVDKIDAEANREIMTNLNPSDIRPSGTRSNKQYSRPAKQTKDRKALNLPRSGSHGQPLKKQRKPRSDKGVTRLTPEQKAENKRKREAQMGASTPKPVKAKAGLEKFGFKPM